ncbi:MAG: DUF4388 domain-containing protein [Candidatus Saccharicenans sp.]
MANSSEKNEAPFSLPFYLFQLWEKQKTGRLRLNPGPYQRTFCLVKGQLTPIKKYFPEKDFLDWLQEIKRIEPPLRLNRQFIGSENTSSVLAILIEHGFLQPQEALELTNEFLAARLIEFFELSEVPLEFAAETFEEWEFLTQGLFTPEVILRGFRKIRRLENLAKFLPSEKELVFRQTPAYVRKLNLKSPELYLWNQLQVPKSLGSLLEQSWLGPTETKKTLIALACLKLVEFNQNSLTTGTNGRLNFLDLEKSLSIFNEKCVFIYKYVAKQLGPVAFNLLEKCYRETQEYLHPIFLNLEIKPDGSFEPRAMLKLSLNELSSEEKKFMLRGFDEILTAELLLVKRNLGNQHEEILAKSLRRVGEKS